MVVRDTPLDVRVAHLKVPPGTAPNVIADHMKEHLARLVSPQQKLLLWFYTPMALPLAAGLHSDFAVYDCMDDLQSFAGAPPELARLEEALLQSVQLVLTGGRTLFRSRHGRHPSVHLFPSSIDAGHFAGARGPGHDPPDQARIPRPRIGFFGVIDERMDLGLVAGIARRRPDWNLVMLGPIAKIDPTSLPRPFNIHWLGPKDYMRLPDYMRHWDAGFMPFARNDATRHISPTKTPEFLAAGLPLVSTSIADVVHDYGHLVAFADDAERFVMALKTALSSRTQGWLARVDATLARSSWDRTWGDIAALIGSAHA
jgi:glycosyltransferase involved in cell wall biosynthesis